MPVAPRRDPPPRPGDAKPAPLPEDPRPEWNGWDGHDPDDEPDRDEDDD